MEASIYSHSFLLINICNTFEWKRGNYIFEQQQQQQKERWTTWLLLTEMRGHQLWPLVAENVHLDFNLHRKLQPGSRKKEDHVNIWLSVYF